MAHKAYGIDFGTGSIKIYKKGEGVVLNERNVVATTGKGDEKKPIAIGDEAYEMFEKVPPNIHVSFPLKNGVIAYMDDMIALWNFMVPKVTGRARGKGVDFYISVPSDISEIEKNAFSHIVSDGNSKPHRVYLVDRPVVDALGLGLDVENKAGIMLVNIGAGCTEISVLSRGGVVVSRIIPYGGNYFDEQIMNYVRKQHNFLIGRKTAENIKKQLVSAVPTNDTMKVTGRDMLKGLPREFTIGSMEIYPLVHDVFDTITDGIHSMLERTPPEIASSIEADGIYMTGASSWLDGMDQKVANETRYKVNTTKQAQRTVIKGLGYLAEHPKEAKKYCRTIS